MRLVPCKLLADEDGTAGVWLLATDPPSGGAPPGADAPPGAGGCGPPPPPKPTAGLFLRKVLSEPLGSDAPFEIDLPGFDFGDAAMFGGALFLLSWKPGDAEFRAVGGAPPLPEPPAAPATFVYERGDEEIPGAWGKRRRGYIFRVALDRRAPRLDFVGQGRLSEDACFAVRPGSQSAGPELHLFSEAPAVWNGRAFVPSFPRAPRGQPAFATRSVLFVQEMSAQPRYMKSSRRGLYVYEVRGGALVQRAYLQLKGRYFTGILRQPGAKLPTVALLGGGGAFVATADLDAAPPAVAFEQLFLDRLGVARDGAIVALPARKFAAGPPLYAVRNGEPLANFASVANFTGNFMNAAFSIVRRKDGTFCALEVLLDAGDELEVSVFRKIDSCPTLYYTPYEQRPEGRVYYRKQPVGLPRSCGVFSAASQADCGFNHLVPADTGALFVHGSPAEFRGGALYCAQQLERDNPGVEASGARILRPRQTVKVGGQSVRLADFCRTGRCTPYYDPEVVAQLSSGRIYPLGVEDFWPGFVANFTLEDEEKIGEIYVKEGGAGALAAFPAIAELFALPEVAIYFEPSNPSARWVGKSPRVYLGFAKDAHTVVIVGEVIDGTPVVQRVFDSMMLGSGEVDFPPKGVLQELLGLKPVDLSSVARNFYFLNGGVQLHSVASGYYCQIWSLFFIAQRSWLREFVEALPPDDRRRFPADIQRAVIVGGRGAELATAFYVAAIEIGRAAAADPRRVYPDLLAGKGGSPAVLERTAAAVRAVNPAAYDEFAARLRPAIAAARARHG